MTVRDEVQAVSRDVMARDPRGGALLASLGEALDPEADPNGWIGVVPSNVIDVETVIDALDGGDASRGRAGKYEVWRNVLILFPIILTWAGLFYAAVGYQTVIASNPELATEPFLLLWEQQFRGLLAPPLAYLDFLRLSNVAIIDVGVLLLVLVFTGLIQRELSVSEHGRDVRRRELSRRLNHTLGAAHLELAKRATIPALVDAFTRTSQTLTEELKAERAHIETLGNERELILNDLRGAARELKAGSGGIAKAAADYTAAAAQLDAAVGGLRLETGRAVASTDGLTAAINLQLQELRHDHDIAKGNEMAIGGLAKAMLDTLERVLPAVGLLGSVARDLQGGADSVLRAIAEDGAGRQAISNEMHLASMSITTAAQAAREAVAASATATSEIAKAVEDIRLASRQMAAMAASGSGSTQESASTVAKAVDGLASVAGQLTGALQASNASNAMTVQALQAAANDLAEATAAATRTARASADRRPPAGSNNS